MAAGERTVKVKFTGDAKDLVASTSIAKRALKSFEKDGVQAAFKGIGGTIASAFTNPATTIIVLAAAAALGSLAGAAMSAAIPLAFGGAAIALGISQAMKDPKVKKELEGFKKTAADVFKDFGAPFKGPVIDALKLFGSTLKALKPDFMEIARLTAPLIDLLAPALAQMAQNSMPGIKAAIQASVPLFKILAEEAPKLATAFSDFLITISKNGPAAAQFLKDFFNVTIFLVKQTGNLLSWLAGQYIMWRAVVIAVANAVKAAWQTVSSWFSGKIVPSIINAINQAKATFNAVANAIKAAGNGIVSAWNSVVGKVTSAINKIIAAWNRLKNLASQAINFTVGGLGGLFGGFRAAGGPVTNGTPYVVGERGPEVFIPRGSGTIVPNHALAGGGDTYVYIGNEALDSRFFKVVKEHDRKLKAEAGAR